MFFQNKGIITKGKKENGTSNGTAAEPEKKKEQYFIKLVDLPFLI